MIEIDEEEDVAAGLNDLSRLGRAEKHPPRYRRLNLHLGDNCLGTIDPGLGRRRLCLRLHETALGGLRRGRRHAHGGDVAIKLLLGCVSPLEELLRSFQLARGKRQLPFPAFDLGFGRMGDMRHAFIFGARLGEISQRLAIVEPGNDRPNIDIVSFIRDDFDDPARIFCRDSYLRRLDAAVASMESLRQAAVALVEPPIQADDNDHGNYADTDSALAF